MHDRLPLETVADNFDQLMGSAYSVSLFTDWQRDRVNEVWVKRLGAKAAPGELDLTRFGATAAARNLHPIAELSAENCTEQMGVPGPWYERLPHFRMGFTPSSGKELQAEYFVPAANGVEAVLAMARMGKRIGPHLMISEVRAIAADDLWMSTTSGRPSIAIHFTLKQDWPAVRALLPEIERELAPFQARPHWGKLFTLSKAQLERLYERLPDFRQAIATYDPKGKFRNEFLATHIHRG